MNSDEKRSALHWLNLIEKAKLASAIFPTGSDFAATYKKLLTLVHPDRFPSEQKERAGKAAARLGELYGEINGKAAGPVLLGKWVVERPLEKGDLADLYLVTSEKQGDGVLKIVSAIADNDLMDAESQALQALWKDEPSEYRKYLPKLLDTFQASGRRVNVLSRHPGYYSLRQIRDLLSYGVPFRHVVWMMNRLLSLIVFSAAAGYVHAGITPDHLLYHPETHGLIVVGWCSAVKIGETVHIGAKAWMRGDRSGKLRAIYPEEVLRKRPVAAGTDIFMAAKSMLWAAEHVPRRFERAFDWCTAASPTGRPQSAVELQDLWIRLAEQEYGKPTYIKLDLPVQ